MEHSFEPLGWGEKKEVGVRRSGIRLSVNTRAGCGREGGLALHKKKCVGM